MENTSYSPRASFVVIFRVIQKKGRPVIQVAVTNVVAFLGRKSKTFKLVGGTAEKLAKGIFENHRMIAVRETWEETCEGIRLIVFIHLLDQVVLREGEPEHIQRFYLAIRWEGDIQDACEDEGEDSPAMWVNLYAALRNFHPSHYDALYAGIDKACEDPHFFELLRQQKGFEDYPNPKESK